jgi:RimJ/RimL family protein N-acetyltransferase
MKHELHIQTERLSLRKLKPLDATALFSYRSLPEVFRYQLWQPAAVSDAAAFIAGTADRVDDPGTWYQLGIFRISRPELMGDIGIHFIDSDRGEVELGFTLAPLFQHQGYATEAVSAVIGYLFKELRKRCIMISVDPRNAPSRRLADRLGLMQTDYHDEQKASSGDISADITFVLNSENWWAEKRSAISEN